jgi:putative oxidoreductase
MTPRLVRWIREGSGGDLGLLILRVGIGAMFVLVHGLPALVEGPSGWETFGRRFATATGITYGIGVWGLVGAATEVVAGLCLMAGVAFRPACVLLSFTMAVAVLYNFRIGLGLASHPFELAILFVSLIFIGAGRLTISRILRSEHPRGQNRGQSFD